MMITTPIVTITIFAGGVRIQNADRIEVFADTKQALFFCDHRDGFEPCLTTRSGYTEWRGSITAECWDNIMIPVGRYRVEAYGTCPDLEAGAGLNWPVFGPNWNVPVVMTVGGEADFNGDGDSGTDADIEAFFACLAGSCCTTCGSADFNHDGDTGTDADIEAFYRAMGGSKP